MEVIPVPTPPQLYTAKQVRFIDPSLNGTIHFMDGSAEVFQVTTGTPPITYVPTAGGTGPNVVPNPTDWILWPRPVVPTALSGNNTGPGTTTVNGLVGLPIQPNPYGPFTVVNNATFQANYTTQYGAAAPAQGVVQ